MQPPPSLSPVFVALAVIFLGIVVRNYLKAEGQLTPARHTWLRVAFIFVGVGIGLYVAQTFLGSTIAGRGLRYPLSSS